jgi:hypothetical protein
MRLVFKKRTSGQIEFGLVYGGIALLALCAARFLPVLTFLPSCPFNELTGIPCPTCGATRSVVHLAQGDILSSLGVNPLTSLCFIAAVLYFFYSLVTLVLSLPRADVILNDPEKSAVRAGAITLAFLNWTYLIVTLSS